MELFEYDIIQKYRNTMMETLSRSFPALTQQELQRAVEYSINKRFKNHNVKLDNNYAKVSVNTNLLDTTEYMKQRRPILTSSGTLYKRHEEVENLLSKLIYMFVTDRDKNKAEMFKYDKGTELFNKFNLAQTLSKRDANAMYGGCGQHSCLYYNIYVAESITRQGRSYISTSIMLFESFLANNIKFNSLNEVIIFINNIINEKNSRNFKDEFILDKRIEVVEVFTRLVRTIDLSVWMPSEKELVLIWEQLINLPQEDLNRIYYKNNLYAFVNNTFVSELVKYILCELDVPFIDPNKPPKNIKNDLERLYELLFEYVYYRHFYIDKLDRIEYIKRDICCIVDTDSTIISLDAWYKFILDKVYDIDMTIKHEKFDMVDVIKCDEFGDYDLREMAHIVEPSFDYDFYTDEFMETQRKREMASFIPQDSLKFSIINIIAYICGKLVIDYLDVYNDYMQANYTDGTNRPCELIMKNEFYFLRALLNGRRNYANYQVLQEGHLIPKKERLDIKGLPINKTTLPDKIKKELKSILLDELMTAPKVDQISLLKRLVKVEKEIYNNVMSGKTDFYKPDNISSMNSYENPLSVNGIIAALVYNELRDDNMPAINLEERNAILKLKIDVNNKNVHKIKDKYPEQYEKMVNLLNHPTLGSKVNTIGFPIDVNVPEWILEFADVKSIINNNLRVFPIKAGGLQRLENNNVNYSNIIKL